MRDGARAAAAIQSNAPNHATRRPIGLPFDGFARLLEGPAAAKPGRRAIASRESNP